jgi:tetratricopeptide (TPR) repeat protein
VLRGLGDLERMLGRNDQARAAYGEALVLYKQVDDRLGQANALSGLGAQQAARCFYEAAQLYEMIGMTEDHDAALREADKLYGAAIEPAPKPNLAAHKKRNQKP